MSRIVRRGIALLILLTALAGCAATVPAVKTSAEAPMSPVTRYKEIRAQMYAAEKAQLNDIAHGASDAELVQMAQEQLLKVCLRDEQELTCEAILEMRGFDNPVVTVGDASVNVILNGESVTAQESAVILELICRETGAEPENVKILPIN